MSKEINKLVVEDLLIQTDLRFKEKEDVYTLNMHLEGVKYPSSKMQILFGDEKVEFMIFPDTPIIPLEKMNDVAYYFSLINPELLIGQFQLKNKAEGEMVPECSIICDTLENRQMPESSRYLISYVMIIKSLLTEFCLSNTISWHQHKRQKR